ncbi:hypothetical protein [Lysinibacillus xylanilyticus]|uniref:hypothetical protein n=1 Tax=Lysinibacillus xylanilyticus TaxID=582475 RepID=UPI003CFCDC72
MEDALLKLLFEFSGSISVKPPTSISGIIGWWDNALKEIDDYWLIDLIESKIFSNSKTPTVQTMYKMLLEQVKKREIENSLLISV